jgi:hypothetical protein
LLSLYAAYSRDGILRYGTKVGGHLWLSAIPPAILQAVEADKQGALFFSQGLHQTLDFRIPPITPDTLALNGAQPSF